MKRLVNEFHALDIRDLSQGGWLTPFTTYEWVWRSDKGTRTASAHVTVYEQSLQLAFVIGPQRVCQDVRLLYSIGVRGSTRRWFACPQCQRRVGILYHAEELPFRCRVCNGLAYPSQYPIKNQSYGRRHRGVSWSESRVRQVATVGA